MLDDPGRVAGDDGPGRDVFDHDRARADDGAFADRHSRTDKGVRTNPRLILNDDGRFEQRQGGIGIVMGAGAELGAMRDRDLFAERHRSEIVDERLFAQRAPVTHRQVPRKINPGGRIGVHVFADAGAKAAQHEAAPAKAGSRAEPERPAAGAPQDAEEYNSCRVFFCRPVRFNIQAHDLNFDRIDRK